MKSNKEEQTEIDLEKTLQEYINDPIYGKFYPYINDTINCICHTTKQKCEVLDYCIIFLETELAVQRVQDSTFPEITVTNIHTEIREKQFLKSYNTPNKILYHDGISELIEMMFIIAVYDVIEKKTQPLKTALMNCRAYLEHCNTFYAYTRNELWKLIAERIEPYSPHLQEDYEQLYLKQKSICEKQEKEIEELKAQITETSDSNIEATEDIHQKVTLETFYHLLEIGGTDFNKTGTKANAARLASYITKIPEPACKNYATHRDVNINTHKVEIVKINSQLQALSLKPI